jgi:hypothetical protein
MTRVKHCIVSSALLFAAAVPPALAASSTASSASEGSSASVGSASDSFQMSSDGSSRATTAAGDYRVIDVAAVAERPGTVRMTLQALAERDAGREYVVYLPERALGQGRVAPGQVVTVKDRAYGLEFARADDRQAFFLVLSDDWYRELQSNAVVL